MRASNDHKTVLSQTINTEYNLPLQRTRKERPESVIIAVISGPGFPKPPLIVDGKFEYPYCCLEFLEDEAKDHHWRYSTH